jgi:phage terminase small subunit
MAKKKRKRKTAKVVTKDDAIFLNEREETFCHEYIKTGNATKSAELAGYSAGKNCEVQGCRLLKKDKIRARLEQIREKVAYQMNVNKHKWMEEVHDMAASNITDVIEVGDNNTMKVKTPEEVGRDIWKNVHSVKIDTTETKAGTRRSVTLKMYSRLDALKTLGQALGYLTPPEGGPVGNVDKQIFNTQINYINNYGKERTEKTSKASQSQYQAIGPEK